MSIHSPISGAEFDAAMAALAPFERAPKLAVAVSGGADSLALVLLADAWVRSRGGRVTALTVDHGLRSESAAEARTVGTWLRARSIDHATLTWDGVKPSTGKQAAARRARYRLLDGWCRDAGVLHLLTAHHADDQAETVLLRLARGSGPDGLAAMAAERFLPNCRLLRPLLGIPKARLVATLRSMGQDWIEDPSNTDAVYARVRARRALAGAGIDATGLAAGAKRLRRAREALEFETADWLGRHAETSPYGWLALDAGELRSAAAEIRIRVLARAALHIGGGDFPPAVAKVEDLERAVLSGRPATLGGAVFRRSGDVLRICREARNLPDVQDLAAGRLRWDGRFEIAGPEVRIAPVGRRRLAAWTASERPAWMAGIPPEALAALPSILVPGGPVAVPEPGGAGVLGVEVRFRPNFPLAGSGFAIA